MNTASRECYRPKRIEDVLLPAPIRQDLEFFLSKKRLGHCLFYGSPGRGKTTLAKAICEHLDADVYEVNCGLDGRIDDVRGLTMFLRSPSLYQQQKVLLLEEADGLSKEAQNGLKAMLEQTNAIVIFTTNEVHKISQAIQSRCWIVNFDSLEFSATEFHQSVVNGLSSKFGVPEETVEAMFEKRQFDIRSTINCLLAIAP